MNNAPQSENEAPKKKTNNRFVIILAALILAGGAFGVTKYIHAQHHEDTDDAQVDGDISPVIPRISGYVTDIRVKDNQIVKAGDTLIVLDNRNEVIQVEQAEAALHATEKNLSVVNASTSASQAGVSTYEANVKTAEAQIEAAKVTLTRATQDYNRYANLIKDHSITQQQFEQAEAAKLTAERQLQVLNDQRSAAMRQVAAASSQTNATAQQTGVVNATIEQRKADLEHAKLNLSYTVIVAPISGRVSKVNVQNGQLLQQGQSLFSIVSESAPWVVANFKETQISRMHPGQKVTVHIDAYPGHDFNGTVSSFSPATGARFALLPPDNASGNFVKVVQRLPVKIELTGTDQLVKELRPGMNAIVDVHID
jgi:membrane fusion protein, multidrug efflux system